MYPIGSYYPLTLLDPDKYLLCSVSINLSILDILCKWNHIVYNRLLLFFFSLSIAFSGSFRLQRASALNSFFKAEYCIVCINMCHNVFVIHPLMGVWVVSTFGYCR